jgi:ribokinase
MNAERRGRVLVIGSANVDVAVATATLPRPGETVFGDSSVISVGGKGANQAVAAAASGAGTCFVARIGDDAFGRMVRDELDRRGLPTDQVVAIPDASTGLAAIYVEHSGQNCIVVVPGANGRVAPADIEGARSLVEKAAILVLQCEIPHPSIYRAVELARASGTPVLLNPAPCHGLDLARVASSLAYLVPNESEAAQLLGQPVESLADAHHAARRLHELGVGCAIVTLGARGCVAAWDGMTHHFAAPRIDAIDTTGAGDAFVGCFAAAIAEGSPTADAIRRAIVYAALSTTRRGAQVSYPDRTEFEAALSRQTSAGG